MSKYIPKEQLEPLMCKPGEEVIQPAPAPQPQPQRQSALIDGRYILMDKAQTYGIGVDALRLGASGDGNSMQPLFDRVPRPLTSKENIEARVTDYENNRGTDERLRLFNRWLDSCTAVAYKSGSTKFKIILESPDLITIDKGFSGYFLPVNYDSLVGIELDRADATYRDWLTKDQVLEHPVWRAVVGEDVNLLRAYVDIVFAEREVERQMAFWTRETTTNGELRALFVSNLYNISDASGDSNLNDIASFLRVAQKGL